MPSSEPHWETFRSVRSCSGNPTSTTSAPLSELRLALELPAEAIRAGIASMPVVPGRFEPVNAGQSFRVIVDFAHTDDALARVLQSAREITPGRLIVLFGCGGDRDRTKRPLMGEVAIKGSDFAVVSSDNPRSEDPLAIIDEVEVGCASRRRYRRKELSGGGGSQRSDPVCIEAGLRGRHCSSGRQGSRGLPDYW